MTDDGATPYPAIHRAMLERYGFGLFPLATYRDTRVEGWRLVGYGAAPVEGYLSGLTMEPRRHVLHQGRTPWMSTGLMEQESHAFHVHAAHGVVVVAGLGMAMYPYAVARKPMVERVIVIERAPEVIEIIGAATAMGDWPHAGKLTLIQADVLDPDLGPHVREAAGGRRPDYLYADIWPDLGSERAAGETATMVRHLNPVAAGWWGQELSLATWCQEQGRAVDEAALRDYATSVGVPIQSTEGYALFCQDIAAARAKPETPSLLSRLLPWAGRKR